MVSCRVVSFSLKACPAWIIFPCHPVIYSRDPVKNTNKKCYAFYWIASSKLSVFSLNDEKPDPRGQALSENDI
ncbi:MAG: hypothetical protein ACRYE8_01135 [Janthinobacterium lividum]